MALQQLAIIAPFLIIATATLIAVMAAILLDRDPPVSSPFMCSGNSAEDQRPTLQSVDLPSLQH